METKIENARIASTLLGEEDHGIFTAYIGLEGENFSVSFGGYALDEWDATVKDRIGTAYGLEFIKHILEVVGVTSWEKLRGQYVRMETEGWGGKVLRIGHLLKNKWFDPAAFTEEMKGVKR